MRRWIVVLVLFVGLFATATPADAFWPFARRHCWGGGWGWRGGYRWSGGYRWGGWGYPYYANYGYGGYPYGGGYYFRPYRGFRPGIGAYTPGYDYGPALSSPAYGLAANAYRPATSVIVLGPQTALPTQFAAPTQAPVLGPTVGPTVNLPPIGASVNLPPIAAAAIQRFLGLKEIRPVNLGNSNFGGGNLAGGNFGAGNLAANFAGGQRPLNMAPIEAPRSRLDEVFARVSNVEYRGKAERMIAEGDELFRAQNFHSALQRYKLAVATAPDLPEALWRQGHALVATHNYELATTAFKKAIALTEDLSRDGFRLSDIYGGATMTKNQHVESLAEWAIKRPNSPDPYFLLGLFLEYDGQTARAERFFKKASDLAGITGGHIAVFLAPSEPARSARPKSPSPAASTPRILQISTGVEI